MDDKDRRKLAVGILVLILFLISMIGEAMLDRKLRRLAFVCLGVACVGIAILVFVFWAAVAHARDSGQWSNSDPTISQWYKTLMQPDNPAVSCCGEADAYWCDEVFSRTENDPNTDKPRVYNFCRITDNRDDVPLRRRPIPIGTEIRIPDHKMKWSETDPQPRTLINPTGHGIVFLSRGDYVYCYVTSGGV